MSGASKAGKDPAAPVSRRERRAAERAARRAPVVTEGPERRSPLVLMTIGAVVVGAIIVAALMVASAAVAPAQETECSAPAAREFDFWIGEWAITQRILREDGSWLELPARTSVSRAVDGCAVIEQWRGEVSFFWEGMQRPEPMTGLSVRAYDPRSARWYIHWMDTRSPRFGEPYVGTFSNGRGEFRRELETPQGRIRLTTREVGLLRALAEREGEAVTRGELLEAVWGLRPDTNTRVVDSFIVRLRRYVEPDPSRPRHIVSVRGHGYRFTR